LVSHARIGKSPAGGTVLWYFSSEGCGADPWKWRCLDSVTGVLVKRSSRSFSALWECAEDAQQHGYVRSPAQMATSFAEGLTRSFHPVDAMVVAK
jgi:hypothetical protein